MSYKRPERKIVKFSSFIRHLKDQKADLLNQVKEQTSALEKWAAQEKLDSEHELKNPEVRNSVLLHEDMETSDSEESEHELDDPDFDDEWKPEQESERDSEQESVIKQNRKRYFKVGRGSSSVMLRRSYEENLLCSDEEVRSTTSSDVCCTCTRKSSCKTMKCQCVAAKGFCGPSCGCSSLKCSNRNASGEQNPQEFDEEDKEQQQQQQQQALASRGASLLRTALADKSVQETNDNEGTNRRRKPLSDIGNTTPSQRKTLKKPVLQLVVDPPPTTLSQEEPQARPVVLDEANGMKLKLPRAMTSVSSNGSNLLMERNADQSVGESVGNGDRPSGSRCSDEKENHTSRI
ncbi:hypothetical protein Bca52824_055531 [Brassica carinata]|uniref:Tesmin/TSO1-like CXC domain-containing protein n=1 Tax=Brassica carinata TaxID=52824 RepID=A0A8X7UNS3_BRACI|nr:hypothetical protein Bca52824_055531 [Brassica carinata]